MAAIAGEGGQDAERERERERARLATAHAALRVFVQWKLQETAHLMRKTIGYADVRRETKRRLRVEQRTLTVRALAQD